MEKYMTWVLGLFMIIFWIVMFRLIWLLVILNLLVGYGIFYANYYKGPNPIKEE
jgi:hypothetical protein